MTTELSLPNDPRFTLIPSGVYGDLGRSRYRYRSSAYQVVCQLARQDDGAWQAVYFAALPSHDDFAWVGPVRTSTTQAAVDLVQRIREQRAKVAREARWTAVL